MRYALRYWNYKSEAFISGLDRDLLGDSDDAAFTRLRTENSQFGRSCSLAVNHQLCWRWIVINYGGLSELQEKTVAHFASRIQTVEGEEPASDF